MADILKQLKQKKTEIEDLQRKKERQEGQKEQILLQLKEKFGVTSIEEGEEKSEELSKKLVGNRKELEELDEKMAKIIQEAQSERASG